MLLHVTINYNFMFVSLFFLYIFKSNSDPGWPNNLSKPLYIFFYSTPPSVHRSFSRLEIFITKNLTFLSKNSYCVLKNRHTSYYCFLFQNDMCFPSFTLFNLTRYIKCTTNGLLFRLSRLSRNL